MRAGYEMSPTARLRLAVLCGLALYFHVPPAMDVWFNAAPSWGQRWRMYHGFGVDICDVRYVRGDTGEPIDRWDVLHRFADAWKVRRLQSEKDVRRQAKTICRLLKEPRPDVRAHARCGSRQGWRDVLKAEENLCE